MLTVRKRRRVDMEEGQQAEPSTDAGSSPASPPARVGDEVVGDADAGEAAVDVRGRPLPPSTVTYLRELQVKVEQLEESMRQRQRQREAVGTTREGASDAEETAVLDARAELSLLVSAGMAELRGVEYRALVNRQGSRAVERWMPHLSSPQLLGLLQAVIPAASELLTDRNASHAVDRLLRRLPPLLVQEAKDDTAAAPHSLSSSLLSLCRTLQQPPSSVALSSSTLARPPSSHWPLLLCDASASHCMRSLVLVLTGHTADIPPHHQQQQQSGQQASRASSSSSAVLVVSPSATAAPSAVSPVFDGCVSSLVSSLVDLAESDRVELAFHASASPALQLLATALASHSTYHHSLRSLVATLCLSPAPSAAAAESDSLALSTAGARHVRELSRHRVGSHLLEVLLSCLAAVWVQGFHCVVTEALLPELQQLALHSTANHVVQRALSAASNAHRRTLQRCNRALRPHMHTLLGQCTAAAHDSTPRAALTADCPADLSGD